MFQGIYTSFLFFLLDFSQRIFCSGYVTRIERNSSPKLTVGDVQLTITYHAVIVLSPILATMIGSIMGLGLPIQLIIDRAVRSLDFGHLFLVIWGCSLVLMCLKFATANQNPKKTEMTTEERKVSCIFRVNTRYARMYCNI